MNFIKKIVKDFLFKIHEKNDAILNKKKQEMFYTNIQTNAIVGDNSTVFLEASIYNNRKDKTKIIIGANTQIKGELLTFAHGGEIKVGDYCFIGERSKIWSAKKILIGNRVLISHNVNIHDNNSHPLSAEKRHEDFKHILKIGLQEENDLNEKEVFIQDDAWIGFNATIMKGVKIGKGAIIGANTIVTADVPDYAVCIGNPMRIVKYLQ